MSLKAIFGRTRTLVSAFSLLPQKFLNWILAEGNWDDTSQWIDTEVWNDEAPEEDEG